MKYEINPYSVESSFDRENPSSMYRLACQTGIGMDRYPDLDFDAEDSEEDESGSGLTDFEDFLLGIRDDGEFEPDSRQDIIDAVSQFKREEQCSSPFFEFQPLDSSVSCQVETTNPQKVSERLLWYESIDTDEDSSNVELSPLFLENDWDKFGEVQQRPPFMQDINMLATEVLDGYSLQNQDTDLVDEIEMRDVEGFNTEKFCINCGLLHAATCPETTLRYDVRRQQAPLPKPLERCFKALEHRLFWLNVIQKWDDPNWYREVTKNYKARRLLVEPSSPPLVKWGEGVSLRAPLPETERLWRPGIVPKSRIIQSQQKAVNEPIFTDMDECLPFLVDFGETSDSDSLSQPAKDGNFEFYKRTRLTSRARTLEDLAIAAKAALHLRLANAMPYVWDDVSNEFPYDHVVEFRYQPKSVRFKEDLRRSELALD